MFCFQTEVSYAGVKAKIKIIFVSPYPTDPKKLPLPKKFYCNFSYKIIFFLLLLITERQKFHVLEGYIV